MWPTCHIAQLVALIVVLLVEPQARPEGGVETLRWGGGGSSVSPDLPPRQFREVIVSASNRAGVSAIINITRLL
jgi:hypothetical protein